MKVTFARAFAPITKQQYEELELQLRVTFPSDYKQFLLNHNGGYFKDFAVYPFLDRCSFASYGMVRSLFGINTGQRCSEISHNFKFNARRLPSNFLAIGDDYFGNLICLTIQKDNFGNIYHWNYEGELEAGYDSADGSTNSNVCLIADSFAQFLECLLPLGIDEDPAEKWKLEFAGKDP